MAGTNVERLRAVGGYEGDWPEGSTYAPEGSGFVRTGRGTRLHLAASDDLYVTAALCGAGVVGTATEQTLDAIVDGENGNRGLCRKCLVALERARHPLGVDECPSCGRARADLSVGSVCPSCGHVEPGEDFDG